MEITNLRFWKSFPFQEGAVEVPSRSSSLPQPDIQYYEGFFPNKDDWLGELQVPDTYLNLMNVNYLSFLAGDAAGNGQWFYGWVDSVEIKSDSPNPMTVVRWHPDLWRMWFSQAVLGSGIVTRRRSSTNFDVPPQPYPHQYMIARGDDEFTVENGNPYISTRGKIFWVYFSAVKTGSTKTACFPVSVGGTGFYINCSGTEVKCPSWANMVLGSWDEEFGLDPQSITSAFISPYPPSTVTGNSRTLSLDGWNGVTSVGTKQTAAFIPARTESAFKERIIDFRQTLYTDDTSVTNVIGFDNEVVGSIPWGIRIRKVAWRVVLGSTAAYVQVRGIPLDMNPDVPEAEQVRYAHEMGICWTIPMIPVEVTSNAQSAYNYSGARQADMDQILLNADRARVAGYMTAANSLLGGSAVGATSTMVGNNQGPMTQRRQPYFGPNNELIKPKGRELTPGGRALAGKGIMTAVGAALSVAATEINYHMSTGEWKDRDMAIRDYRAAHQTNGLLMSGSGFDSCIYGGDIMFREMEWDNYSVMQRNADMYTYGAYVFEPHENCDAILPTAGPIQIQNLVVTGPIPPQAAAYIKERFAKGVILK